MLRRMKIFFIVPLPDLNPACSLQSLQSIPLRIRSTTIFPNILQTTGRRVTPASSCTPLGSPFLGILTKSPLFHLAGTFSNLQFISISSFTLSVENSRSALSSSYVTRSSPGGFPFLRLYIALFISAGRSGC